jgi:hypothetical protein
MRATFFLLFLALALAPAQPASDPGPDRDTREVLGYSLTEAGLAKYARATRSLAALPGGMPGACDDDTPESVTLNQVAAKLDAVPGASAAIRSAGMTTREYVMFSWSIFHHGLAAWALGEPGGTLPPETSMANVEFFKKHTAELEELEGLRKKGDCDGEQSADQEEDEEE